MTAGKLLQMIAAECLKVKCGSCKEDSGSKVSFVCAMCISDVDPPLDTASRLFSSSVGVRVLSDSLQQTAETRLSVCRDLLVLVVLMQRLNEQVCPQLKPRSD